MHTAPKSHCETDRVTCREVDKVARVAQCLNWRQEMVVLRRTRVASGDDHPVDVGTILEQKHAPTQSSLTTAIEPVLLDNDRFRVRVTENALHLHGNGRLSDALSALREDNLGARRENKTDVTVVLARDAMHKFVSVERSKVMVGDGERLTVLLEKPVPYRGKPHCVKRASDRREWKIVENPLRIALLLSHPSQEPDEKKIRFDALVGAQTMVVGSVDKPRSKVGKTIIPQ